MEPDPSAEEGWPTEHPPCPLCGTDGPPEHLADARDEIRHRPGRFGIARCRDCGLVFTSPRPTAGALGRYYEDVYSGEVTARMRRALTSPGMRALLGGRLALLRRHAALSSGSRLCDVGCSYGTLLDEAHRRLGCSVAGCDPDAGSLEHSVAPAGADLRLGDLSAAGFDVSSFDAVTFFHSLEHTPDPVAALREARRILAPGGTLVVEVPNWGALWRRLLGRFWFPLLVPQHLVHFELATLRAAAERAGFSEVVLLRGFFAPLALTLSFALALVAVFGPPPEGRRPLGRWLLHKALSLPVLAAFFLIDLPSAVLLSRSRWSNHQVLIARR